MDCPECRAALPDEDRFCSECGHAFDGGPAGGGLAPARTPPEGPLGRDLPLTRWSRSPRRLSFWDTEPSQASLDLSPLPSEPEEPREPESSPAPTTHNTLSGGVTDGPVIQAGTITGGVTIHSGAPAQAAADNWPRVGRLHRSWFGVRPTSRFGDEPGLPPYVGRDCDGELHRLVGRGLAEGGLVVVTGGPLSGKTSTAAWAALTAWDSVGADEPRVHAPHPGADLSDLPFQLHDRTGPFIVWLDDLEGHLGPRGLTTALLARFAQERVLVLATMRDKAYDEHRFGERPAARVLSGAHTVELSRRWSDAELRRLGEADDPRLADAREWRGKRGVTEYLALGPELWDEWRRARRAQAHPRGHLLVRAAVDLARCGLRQDVPLPVLSAVQELYSEYSAQNPHAVLPGESELFEDALAWATRPRYEATGLLVPGATEGTYRAYGSLVADAVRSGALGAVPDEVWADVCTVGSAHGLDVAPVAEACRAALASRGAEGDIDACVVLGIATEFAGDVSEAEGWYRKAADQGHAGACNQLGHILAGRGAAVEAIHYLEQAAAGGCQDAYVTLGKLHRDRARHWLTKGAEAGDPQAAFHLAELLLRPGRVERSVHWYREAAEAGHRDAGFALNVLRVGITLRPEREDKPAKRRRPAPPTPRPDVPPTPPASR
ncbi:zinc-ribbon domain-containing protein [Streptomyces flavofungini]|uniref:zinc-ribbon domain-containing protein n=1 Tax=Streptomyces flavofungini TaxID=68200 RepID=UPI0025AFB216|nr:zinc-ribbon domain-containing protein [Streptomyces flavofungini]WJV48244.1 sel1 repeat family protein [Streptomyces flavofungini]